MHSVRGDGPPKKLKRQWQHKLRARMRYLLTQDPDETVYPTRAGDIWEWW